jgi:hypothetical protein
LATVAPGGEDALKDAEDREGSGEAAVGEKETDVVDKPQDVTDGDGDRELPAPSDPTLEPETKQEPQPELEQLESEEELQVDPLVTFDEPSMTHDSVDPTVSDDDDHSDHLTNAPGSPQYVPVLVKVPAARKIARDAPTTLAPVLAKQVPTKQKPYNPPSPVPGPADVPDSKSDESDPSSAVAVKIDSFAKLAVAFVGFAALFL